MGDSKLSPKCGKEKVLLKLTLRKVSTVSDVLHMLYIHQNLLSISLPGKTGVRILFDLDKIMLAKNNGKVSSC